MVQNLTVPGTSINGQIRTITAQGLSGDEIAWRDNGFESVSINETNYLKSSRLMASKVNADDKLDLLPGNKSFTMNINLTTDDSTLSPLIDLRRINTILTSNRVNRPITDFANDPRVNSMTDDPNAFVYITKEFALENPATSLKVLLNANVTAYADVRCFYATNDA